MNPEENIESKSKQSVEEAARKIEGFHINKEGKSAEKPSEV